VDFVAVDVVSDDGGALPLLDPATTGTTLGDCLTARTLGGGPTHPFCAAMFLRASDDLSSCVNVAPCVSLSGDDERVTLACLVPLSSGLGAPTPFPLPLLAFPPREVSSLSLLTTRCAPEEARCELPLRAPLWDDERRWSKKSSSSSDSLSLRPILRRGRHASSREREGGGRSRRAGRDPGRRSVW
jgi:hypothetical protein